MYLLLTSGCIQVYTVQVTQGWPETTDNMDPYIYCRVFVVVDVVCLFTYTLQHCHIAPEFICPSLFYALLPFCITILMFWGHSKVN
jgi:hypothetical protein